MNKIRFCDAHIEMVKDIAEIRVKLESIDAKIASAIEPMKTHIKQGEMWRIALIGVIFAGIVQIVTFAYMWGCLNTTVVRNTTIILDLQTRIMEKAK